MSWATLSTEHTESIIELINSGDDRIVALIGGALLEEAIERTLAERLLDGGTKNKLLKGALATPSSQADLLYVLRAVDKTTLQTLQGLIAVRNFFAHRLKTSFKSSDEKFLAGMKELKLHLDRERYPHHYLNDDFGSKIEKIKTNKDKYIVNLKLALIFLMRDRLRHETWSNTPRSEETVTGEWTAMLRKLEKESKEKYGPKP